MKTLKIKPLHGIVQVNLQEATAGVLDTSSRNSSVEYAEVLAVGEGVEGIEKGDHVFVKSWGIDHITHGDQKFFFIHQGTHAILAVVK